MARRLFNKMELERFSSSGRNFLPDGLPVLLFSRVFDYTSTRELSVPAGFARVLVRIPSSPLFGVSRFARVINEYCTLAGPVRHLQRYPEESASSFRAAESGAEKDLKVLAQPHAFIR